VSTFLLVLIMIIPIAMLYLQACSLLLGHPWELGTNAVHHGRTNKYTLMHKGKKITLLLLTPNEIVQCDRAIAETAKC
jgi:hypothetical protein